MSIHSHRSENGRYVRIPHLFEVDLTGDKLGVGKAIFTFRNSRFRDLFFQHFSFRPTFIHGSAR